LRPGFTGRGEFVVPVGNHFFHGGQPFLIRSVVGLDLFGYLSFLTPRGKSSILRRANRL
jgi:hypothetical protein